MESNMNKKDDRLPENYKVGTASGKVEELRLFVPTGVLAKFRRISNKSKMTAGALFEEMVDTYAHGLGIDSE